MKTTDEKKNLRAVKAEDYFYLNIKLMSLCGLKCGMTEKLGTFYNKIPTFTANAMSVIFLVYEMNFIVFALKSHDTALASQILSQFISNIQCIAKGFLFALAVEKIQSILHEIKHSWEKYPPDDDIRESVIKIADQTLTFCKCYVTANFICIISHVLPLGINLVMQYQARGATNNTYDFSHVLVLIKYPFEVTRKTTFLAVFFVEAFVVIMNVIFWVSTDSLFAQMTTHMYLQLKVLKRDVTVLFNCEAPNEKEIVLTLVKRHREFIRICDAIEEIFSPIIFFTVFLSSVNMCLNVIGVRETINKKAYCDAIIYATILTITIFQIFFFCIFAEKISEETRSLADAVYNLNWTTKDYKLRFYLSFIITRAQKPFYCTAYGFFPIGHTRLTSIIRASYSYYMMLETTDRK